MAAPADGKHDPKATRPHGNDDDPPKWSLNTLLTTTISGVMMSPFRLPPAARPLVQKVKQPRQPGDVKRGVTSLIKNAAPWMRGRREEIRAGVPGTPDGGPPPAPVGTAKLLAQPWGDAANVPKWRLQRTPRKRQLVDIGMHLWRYGMLRGLFAALLLLGAVYLPQLMPADRVPAGTTSQTPPWFLAGVGDQYRTYSLIAIAAVAVAALALPSLLRGLVMLVVGFAPFAVVMVATTMPELGLQLGLRAPPAPPAGLEGHTLLVLGLFPAWVAMASGMVAGQNFPDSLPARLAAGVGGGVVIGQQIIGSGVLTRAVETRLVAIEGLLSILLFAMALVAIGQMMRGSIALCISFVKAGLLLVVAVPVILVVWQLFGPVESRFDEVIWFRALHGLLLMMACFLIATIGGAEMLHGLAWRGEVARKLGKQFVKMNPRKPAFRQQFMTHVEQSGVFSADEVQAIRKQLERRLAAARSQRG